MKRTLLIFLVLTSFAFDAFAQSQEDFKIDTIDLTKKGSLGRPADTSLKVFTLVESKPAFPGGIHEFYKYLGQNIDIPSNLFIKGQVLVSFIIDLNGNLVETKIEKGIVTEGMRKEIVRVFDKSPKWVPAMQNGKPVKVLYFIPINF